MGQRKRISDTTFDELLNRLTAHAVRLFGTAGLRGPDTVLKGTGKSPEDLAMETILKLTGGELKYHRSKGPLVPYLAKVMERDFLDLLRLKSYQTTEIVPPLVRASEDGPDGKAGGRSLDSFTKDSPGLNVISEAEEKSRILDLVKGDQELEDYVVAVLDFHLEKREEIAERLRTDPADITNRRKRVRRRLAEHFGREKR